MAEYIVMPKLGFDMREGILNQWLKSVGDPVSRGEVVAEIESDKATLDLETQVDGILLHLIEKDGAIVPIGAHMAIVGAEGEDFSQMLSVAANIEGIEYDVGEDAEGNAIEGAAQTTPAAVESAPDDSSEFPRGVKATPVAWWPISPAMGAATCSWRRWIASRC